MKNAARRALSYLPGPLSGLLLVAGFPYYNIFILPWIALVPMLMALRGKSTAARCLLGYLFGVAFLGALFHWIALVRYPAVLGYFIFLLVIPLIFIPWAALTGWALDRDRPWPALLLPGLLWAALELAMSYGTFAFPWWSLAVSQASNLPLAQSASVWGMYGVSLIVVTSNVLVLRLIEKKAGKQKIFWLVCGALLLAVFCFGAATLARKPVYSGRPVKVSLVQGGYTQEEKIYAIEQGVDLMEMYSSFWEMSEKAVKDTSPGIIVWPESVLPIEMLTSDSFSVYTLETLDKLGATLVSGVYEGAHNSVIAISPEIGMFGKYDKMQLVPFGEFVPWRKQLGFTPGLKKWLDEKVFGEDVEAGSAIHIFDDGGSKFAAMICFESMVPHISRRMTADGAEMLFVVTNDAWFLHSPAASQHVALARLRAIENRRWVAQAANTGLSVIIDPRGRVTKSSVLFTREIISGEMYPVSSQTFYTRHGDVIGLIFLFAVPAIAGFLFVRDRLKKSPGQKSSKKKNRP